MEKWTSEDTSRMNKDIYNVCAKASLGDFMTERANNTNSQTEIEDPMRLYSASICTLHRGPS